MRRAITARCRSACCAYASDPAIEAIARSLRPMDLIAEDAGDDYLVILPELARTDGQTAIDRMLDFARATGVTASAATVLCPEDGTAVETLIGKLRAALRGGNRTPATPAPPLEGPIVIDAAMRRVYSLVDRIADSAMTVMILGETGVGKELVAERDPSALDSPRASRSIKLNCAALPESLLESELFGYERGAFTGAERRKRRLLRGARTAARCFSTRSARCRSRSRPSCSACSSARSSRASAAPPRSRPTRA